MYVAQPGRKPCGLRIANREGEVRQRGFRVRLLPISWASALALPVTSTMLPTLQTRWLLAGDSPWRGGDASGNNKSNRHWCPGRRPGLRANELTIRRGFAGGISAN
ncbi:MAG: hypothetical protein ACI9HK_000715 [Pirellulaceae bacterium]|jgi:hypothetical protein